MSWYRLLVALAAGDLATSPPGGSVSRSLPQRCCTDLPADRLEQFMNRRLQPPGCCETKGLTSFSPCPQTCLPSLVPSLHQHVHIRICLISLADLSPRPSCTNRGKDRGAPAAVPTMSVCLSPPGIDTFGWVVQQWADPGLEELCLRGSRATFTRKLPSLSFSSVVFIQDGSLLSHLKIGFFVCVHIMPFFFFRALQPVTGQRRYKPKVYHNLILTGLNMSTMFTMSPVL